MASFSSFRSSFGKPFFFFFFNMEHSKEKVLKSIPLKIIISIFAAAAAKSLQSCPTLWDPIDGNPRGPAVPRILEARILEWVAISFSSA